MARSEEAVFQWVRRWWEAGARPEAELLAVLRHVRFAAMAAGFLRETVVAWPALGSAEARGMLLNATLPAVDGTKVVPRSGVGPRVIYVVGGNVEGGRLSTTELYDRRPPRGRSGQAWQAHAPGIAASLSMASSTPWAAAEPLVSISTRRRCTTRRPMAGSLWPR